MKRVLCTLLLSVYITIALSAGNPWLNADFFINPDYVVEVQSTISQFPNITRQLQEVQNVSAAYWIDTMARIANFSRVLSEAQAQQQRTGRNLVVAFIVYDLPDRDCSAAASNGEISCADATCTEGINTYKTQYIDPIVAAVSKYPQLTLVAVIEPDSLGNLATNLNVPKCEQAQAAYYAGVSYAVQQLAAVKNVAVYLDAAHGGWLGWDNNRAAIAQVFQKVLSAAGGADLIRGFSTNVANYQPLGSLSSTDDPCHLMSQYNKAINEVMYVSLLSATLETVGITDKGYIIDTGRNGVTNMRSDCSNWCNIDHAGLGIRPTTDTSDSGLDIIDAYYWLKTPGESDGSSDPNAPRYDFHCGSVDSFKPSPEAGEWNSAFFAMLVNNANPPL